MSRCGRLIPDHKTIADFRKDSGPAIKQVCVQFVELCRPYGSAHDRVGECPLLREERTSAERTCPLLTRRRHQRWGIQKPGLPNEIRPAGLLGRIILSSVSAVLSETDCQKLNLKFTPARIRFSVKPTLTGIATPAGLAAKQAVVAQFTLPLPRLT